MGLACGIVGLPNVGKSTVFNAITKAGIEAANYPFCTIDPNTGIVEVPDQRLSALAQIVKPQCIQPATVEFVDIAGLVKGASSGEGLGNQFLGHIRAADAIVHVVRCFDDPDIAHVSGQIDPIADIEVIQLELCLADLATTQKALKKWEKQQRAGQKEAKAYVSLLRRVEDHLNANCPVSTLTCDEAARVLLKSFHFLTQKPVLYVANVDEHSLTHNAYVDKVQQYAHAKNAPCMPICAALESEIATLPESEKAEFLESIGTDRPGLDRVIRAGYRLLGLQTYFTAGPKEVRAWTFPKGASAPQAAGVIHSDFEKGFIRAEVIAYEDYMACQGVAGAKAAGKWRLEGRDYVVSEGDVMHFRTHV